MRILTIVISTLILLSPFSSSTDTKGWRGIVPLRSTRADVEALFGEGTNQCKCSYYLDDMNIFFVYSSGDCENGGSGDWNIAPDTVIRFTIYPKTKPRLSDISIDESQFEKRQDIGDALIYINHEEGFSIDVQQGTAMSFNYGPAVGDENLRCPGYDGIHYSSSIPRELRARLLERLNQFVHYSFTGQY
ncbi:MAG TPA: hypothetical protein VFM05_14525 [Candidatus Saccharimonadales bacterium]|nr:hypothetical protein [Candidatus Saccharimonadales bacterium]